MERDPIGQSCGCVMEWFQVYRAYRTTTWCEFHWVERVNEEAKLTEALREIGAQPTGL